MSDIAYELAYVLAENCRTNCDPHNCWLKRKVRCCFFTGKMPQEAPTPAVWIDYAARRVERKPKHER